MTTENEESADPTYEELDAEADQAADEQIQLMTHHAELVCEDRPAEEIAVTTAAREDAVRAAQPIHETLVDYELDYDDPAVPAAEALERDRAEEYARYIAEEEELGLDPAEYVLERAIE